MVLSPRYLVVVNLLLLALAAYSASGIAGTAIAARVVPPPAVEILPPPAPLAPPKAHPVSYYAVIQQRDIFNSAKPAEPVQPAEVKTTQLRVRLWGVAVRGPTNSYCIIEDQSQRPPKQELFRVNDMVAGIAKVKAIEWDKVILERDGADEILELTPDPNAHAAAGVAAGVAASVAGNAAGGVPPGGSARTLVNDANIRAIGENAFEIDKAEVDKAFENLGQLFTQMRAVPHFEGGKSIGFRLFAIRSGSLFDKIGLRNGDIIKRINAVDMNDPTKALAMLEEFRNERNLTVELMRNRQDQTLSYVVR